ncbi:MAG: LapA family protein [Nocardioides sp.]|uniref:lipopolysaccharide assembly protein LapA domain-containing protein n=1 Tax=Nocardioides sp. TaxID=35761 RepID=UPI0039E4DE6A
MSDPSASSPRQLSPKVITAVVLAVLALIFVVQNTGKGRIHFLFWTLSMPSWIWLLVMFLVGAVVGSIFPWFRRKRS